MTRPVYSTPKRLIRSILLMFIGMIVCFSASVLYTNNLDRESNRAWCDIFNSLAKRNAAIENPDAATLEFRNQLQVLIRQYGC